MNNLWEKEFIPQNVKTSKEIIEKQCEYLEKSTKGNIIAKIIEYKGTITSYIQKGIISSMADINYNLEDKEINIQRDLGEIISENFVYEFFISSKSTPNYKYRIMFIKYNIEFYPTLIVLDETIAKELELNQNITNDTQEIFETNLKSILNSKKLEKVITALLAIAKKEALSFF